MVDFGDRSLGLEMAVRVFPLTLLTTPTADLLPRKTGPSNTSMRHHRPGEQPT